MLKRRWLWIIAVIVAVSSAIAVRHAYKARVQKRRDVANQATLLTYSQNLRPGLTRKEIEDYLHSRGTAFTQMCCLEQRSALTDLVKVGEEEAPWYCSEWTVFIALEFDGIEPQFRQA